jgi:hypothetical protein
MTRDQAERKLREDPRFAALVERMRIELYAWSAVELLWAVALASDAGDAVLEVVDN